MPFTEQDSAATPSASHSAKASSTPRRYGSSRALAAVCGALALTLLGGCTSVPTVDKGIRQATIERWMRCVERQAHGVPMNSRARSSIEQGCEGHRRDVVHAFPPYMKQRLDRMLDEQEIRLTRTTFVKRGGADTKRQMGALAGSLSAN